MAKIRQKSERVPKHMQPTFDANWCLPSRIPENSLIWMLEVDGLIVDIRWMSREIQEIAYEKGMIPYIPADREREEAK